MKVIVVSMLLPLADKCLYFQITPTIKVGANQKENPRDRSWD
jgi:hypothetical protein